MQDKSILIEKLNEGYVAKVAINSGNLGCSDVQDLYNRDGYVNIYKQGDNFCIDDEFEDYNVFCVDSPKYIEDIVKNVFSYTPLNREVEEYAENLFLKTVCRNTACGSQRCDGSHIWIGGCKLYQDFKETIEDKITELLK